MSVLRPVGQTSPVACLFLPIRAHCPFLPFLVLAPFGHTQSIDLVFGPKFSYSVLWLCPMPLCGSLDCRVKIVRPIQVKVL